MAYEQRKLNPLGQPCQVWTDVRMILISGKVATLMLLV